MKLNATSGELAEQDLEAPAGGTQLGAVAMNPGVSDMSFSFLATPKNVAKSPVAAFW